MTNILVPTDFTPASLKMAEIAIKNSGENKINIVLFHAFALPFSEFDLLGGFKDPSSELVTESFRIACKQLKDEYPKQIGKIIIRTMNGDSKALFRNFVDANDIDLICCPDYYLFTKVHQRSIDPTSFFKKCGLPIIREVNKTKEPVFSNQTMANQEMAMN